MFWIWWAAKQRPHRPISCWGVAGRGYATTHASGPSADEAPRAHARRTSRTTNDDEPQQQIRIGDAAGGGGTGSVRMRGRRLNGTPWRGVRPTRHKHRRRRAAVTAAAAASWPPAGSGTNRGRKSNAALLVLWRDGSIAGVVIVVIVDGVLGCAAGVRRETCGGGGGGGSSLHAGIERLLVCAIPILATLLTPARCRCHNTPPHPPDRCACSPFSDRDDDPSRPRPTDPSHAR